MSRKPRRLRGNSSAQAVARQGDSAREQESRLGARLQHMQMRAEVASWSSPVPPPEILAAYNQVVPDGADRIMRMAEQQQTHRHGLEREVVQANIKRERDGLWVAAGLSALVISIGGLLIWNDKPTEGLVAIVGTLVTLAAVFIWGRSKNIQELARKRAADMFRAAQAQDGDPDQLSLLPPPEDGRSSRRGGR